MEAGKLIQDRYELVEEIGSGGMATVWRASDRRLGRDVAVKFLAPRLAEDPEFLVRFFAEAQGVARISDPHVVGILDFGQSEGSPYLVMEYLPDGCLADLTGQPVEPDKALELIAQAATGVGAAHAIGLVHRDVKPANILIDASGQAQIADFGIASAVTSEHLTATGTAIGSPHYISPEQVEGKTATPASDVYSLGVVLYELLTGRRPFEGDNITAIAIAHVDRQPEPPSRLVDTLDPTVDALVMRALAKDPDERWPDAGALAAAIASLDPELPVEPDTGVLTLPEYRRARPRGLAATLVILALLLITGAALIAASSGDEPAQADAQATADPTKSPRRRSSPSPTQSVPAAAAPSSSASPSPEADENTSGDGQKKPKPDPEPDRDQPDDPEPEPTPTPTPDAQPTPQPSQPAEEPV